MRKKGKKSMKRRAISWVFALALFISIVPLAGAEQTGFSDVSPDAPYAQAVAWCRARGLMIGVSGGRFAPEGTLTRAMLATVLYRAEGGPAVSGGPAFLDTQPGMWYADAVIWVDVNRVMKGYGYGRFGTNDPVTREQLATILWRHSGRRSADTAGLSDEEAVSRYAKEAVNWAVAAGVMAPRGDGFQPKQYATRAEIASALYAYLAPQEKEESKTKKILVAYYSATGGTRGIAQTVSQDLGGDLFEIVPAQPYTTSDLNYNNASSRVSREHDDPSLRAMELKALTPEGWEEYDVVLIGYPIWWGEAAWPVESFVKGNDFTDKIVIPFCTSASSGLGRSGDLLEAMATGGDWRTGYRFSASAPHSLINDWLASLGI